MGRATALMLAKRHENVVLAARRADALEALARDCTAAGGNALAVPTDVSDETAVDELVLSATAHFGHFDACVNAAAVQPFGHLWDLPPRTIRRVIDVNLVGSLLVARAALRHFRERGRGTLVLVSSILSKTPSPYLNAYTASKHGIAGLATSLRTDLKLEGSDEKIHVVNLMPPSTDTPFFAHAANYVGKIARPPEPACDVETLADAIVKALDDPKDEIVVGAIAKAMRSAHAVAPAAYESVAARMTSGMFTDEAQPPTEGNLFQPMTDTDRRSGGWKEGSPLKSRETRS